MARLNGLHTVAALVLAGMAGCAAVDVRRVTDHDQPGIRYWRPAPYLALKPSVKDKEATCEASIVMLPDKSEEYAITMRTGLWGNVEAKPTLTDGWNLTSLEGKVESKTTDAITAVTGLIKAFVPVAKSAQGAPGEPQLSADAQQIVRQCKGLYRFVFDPVYGHVVGLDPVPMPVPIAIGKPNTPTAPSPGDKPKS